VQAIRVAAFFTLNKEAPSMPYQSILYSTANRVATVTLNRPETLNALNEPIRNDVYDALGRAMNDPEVRAIVIAANGRGFSSGTDLQEAADKQTYDLLEEEYKPVFNRVMQSPKPVIAAVHGVCAGVGASFALACDLIVMGENAFIYLAFANVGLIPDGGMCWHLARSMGPRRAYQVIAEGGRIPAGECLELGLVNKVVPDDKLLDEATQWAQRLAQAAPLALKYAKVAVQQAMRCDLSDTMRLEAGLQSMCATSRDGEEGVRAFLEKRKPVFTGR